MDHLSFQNRIQVYGHHLSKSERKIAAYIVEHPEQARLASSRELAMSTGTSNSTLTRFCQKLGYRNFIEFQTLLSAESAPRKVPGQVLFGLGSSGLTASEFNMRLVQMGFTSSAMTDTFLMRVQSSLFSPKDLVIAVSNSGETPEVVSACRIAKSVGAQIGLLTQRNQTELTQIADSVLYAGDIHQTGDRLFINSQMPLMFLIDAVSYRLLENDTCRENRDHALQILFHRES